MKRKLALLFSALFFVLFLGLGWFSVNSIARRLQITHLEARFGAAEAALRNGRMKAARRGYYGGVQAWQQALKYGGYYPILSGEYLLAGNCYQQQRQPRAALKCYEEGLTHDPFSISLLTSLGACAFHLGENDKARSAWQKSSLIFPLKKDVRPLWKELRRDYKGAERCVK